MTDLEFYQKALSFQSWFVNRISEIKAYGKHWSDEFCLKEIRNATEKYFTDEHVKEVFTLDNLTKERAKHLRFGRWDEDEQPDLYLFPLWFVLFLPYGTKVISIGGDTFEYSKETDLDIRFGCVAFGVELKQQLLEEMLLARDENGSLYFHGYSKPKKDTLDGMWISDNYNHYLINTDLFTEVQWSDEEPTKVKLEIVKQ